MRLTILCSSSAGNSAVVEHASNAVMIDAGLSKKRLLALFFKFGIVADNIRSILLTHSHLDHTAGAAQLADYLRIPIIGTKGTLDSLPSSNWLLAIPEDQHFVLDGTVNGLGVESVPVSHDAVDPCGYVIECGGFRLGWFTDLGVIDAPVEKALNTCDAAFIEASYDEDALAVGPYEPSVKQRIRGPLGHLSNTQVAEYLKSASRRLKHVILGHLSDSANNPELIFQTIRQVRNDLFLTVVPKSKGLETLTFQMEGVRQNG